MIETVSDSKASGIVRGAKPYAMRQVIQVMVNKTGNGDLTSDDFDVVAAGGPLLIYLSGTVTAPVIKEPTLLRFQVKVTSSIEAEWRGYAKTSDERVPFSLVFSVGRVPEQKNWIKILLRNNTLLVQNQDFINATVVEYMALTPEVVGALCPTHRPGEE